MAENPSQFRARRENILLRQLIRITRHMTVETVTRMQARGIEGMMPAYPRLLGNLDTEGTRIGALARKMGTTRQATAQLAKEIADAGFVERVRDSEDGRGVIVKFTPKGRDALACAMEVMAQVEAEYEAIIGAESLHQLKEALGAVLAIVDETGQFGLD